MPKLKISDLEKIRNKVRRTTILREGGKHRARIVVHMGTCGIAAGARKVLTALLKEIESRKIDDVFITTSGCAGLCSREPMATVELPGKPPVKYVDLTEKKIVKILNEHVLGGNLIIEYVLGAGSEKTN